MIFQWYFKTEIPNFHDNSTYGTTPATTKLALWQLLVFSVYIFTHILGKFSIWFKILWSFHKLDEWMARRHLKSPRLLSGRALHLTLVTKWSWSWSWMTYSHPLCWMSIGPPVLRYSYFKILPWKSMVKVMCVVKGSHLTLKIQRSRSWSRSNPLVPFEAWSSIDMFAFRFVAIGPLLVEIQQIPYLTLKIQGQGHGQGQTWWLHLRPWAQSICLLFIPYLTLKTEGQGHDEHWPKSNQVIYRSGPTIMPRMKEIQNVQKLSCEQESAAGAGGVLTGTKT